VYMHRSRLAPALGKTAEAKRLLADHVRHLQGQGQRLTLSERIYSSEGPMLLVTHVAGELADIERVQARCFACWAWRFCLCQVLSVPEGTMSRVGCTPPPRRMVLSSGI